MGFDLVVCRNDLVVDDQIHQVIGVEFADTDCFALTFLVEVLQSLPRPVDIAERGESGTDSNSSWLIQFRLRWNHPTPDSVSIGD